MLERIIVARHAARFRAADPLHGRPCLDAVRKTPGKAEFKYALLPRLQRSREREGTDPDFHPCVKLPGRPHARRFRAELPVRRKIIPEIMDAIHALPHAPLRLGAHLAAAARQRQRAVKRILAGDAVVVKKHPAEAVAGAHHVERTPPVLEIPPHLHPVIAGSVVKGTAHGNGARLFPRVLHAVAQQRGRDAGILRVQRDKRVERFQAHRAGKRFVQQFHRCEGETPFHAGMGKPRQSRHCAGQQPLRRRIGGLELRLQHPDVPPPCRLRVNGKKGKGEIQPF